MMFHKPNTNNIVTCGDPVIHIEKVKNVVVRREASEQTTKDLVCSPRNLALTQSYRSTQTQHKSLLKTINSTADLRDMEEHY